VSAASAAAAKIQITGSTGMRPRSDPKNTTAIAVWTATTPYGNASSRQRRRVLHTPATNNGITTTA